MNSKSAEKPDDPMPTNLLILWILGMTGSRSDFLVTSAMSTQPPSWPACSGIFMPRQGLPFSEHAFAFSTCVILPFSKRFTEKFALFEAMLPEFCPYAALAFQCVSEFGEATAGMLTPAVSNLDPKGLE